jgi:hypothetical protein
MAYNGTGRNELVSRGGAGVINNYFSFPNYVGDKRELIQTVRTEVQRTASRN